MNKRSGRAFIPYRTTPAGILLTWPTDRCTMIDRNIRTNWKEIDSLPLLNTSRVSPFFLGLHCVQYSAEPVDYVTERPDHNRCGIVLYCRISFLSFFFYREGWAACFFSIVARGWLLFSMPSLPAAGSFLIWFLN